MAVDRNLACIGRVKAGDAADERRLSRAVVADQPDDLAGPDFEIDILKRVQAAEGLAEPGDTEEGSVPLDIRFTPRAGAG